MRNLMSDQQYQALSSRGAGARNLPSPLLHVRSHPQSAQYLSRKPYGDRVVAVADPYHPEVGTFSLASAASSLPQIPQPNIVDRHPDSPEIRAQLTAERQSVLPSHALIEHGPPQAYSDYIRSKSMHRLRPVSPEVPPVTYPGQFSSPLHPAQVLPNGSLMAPSPDFVPGTQRPDHNPPFASNGYGRGMRRLAPSRPYEEQGGFAAGSGSGGSLRRGQELDHYLLGVKPEKFVRYAASCLAPEPPYRLSLLGSHVNPDDDVYSNYRRAKARRTESNGFRSISPSSQRDRERERYRDDFQNRERKRGGAGASQDHAKKSPNRNSRKGIGSQASEGMGYRGGAGSQKQDIQLSDTENGKRRPVSKGDEAKVEGTKRKEEDGNHESDKDSELGSLCADLSDSEDEKAKKSAARASAVIDGALPGMIFGCSSATFHECMRLRLFGLPARNKNDVMRVAPGTKVFLFNFDTKELSGIFEATSHGGWQIHPDAFRDFGGFPAQVEVCCSEQCPNVPQSLFRPLIKENYISQTKFKFDLNSKQVKDLTKLFRKEARERSRRQIDLAERFRSAGPPFDNYSAIGEQQQILFHR